MILFHVLLPPSRLPELDITCWRAFTCGNGSLPSDRTCSLVPTLDDAKSTVPNCTVLCRDNALAYGSPQPVVSALKAEVCTPGCFSSPAWQTEIISKDSVLLWVVSRQNILRPYWIFHLLQNKYVQRLCGTRSQDLSLFLWMIHSFLRKFLLISSSVMPFIRCTVGQKSI